jgi:predicted DNA-binding transcriptional regulator AlpA
MEYEFTLKYQLDSLDSDFDDLVERLGAGGCTDALVGIGQSGRLGLRFMREARSAKDALLSAMFDVRRSIPSARLIEAGPDFVGLSDAAEMLGMTRQNLRKLMMSNPTFPIPVHDGSSGLWHLADLLKWLRERDYDIASEMVEVSTTARRINATKESLHISPEEQREMADLVC